MRRALLGLLLLGSFGACSGDYSGDDPQPHINQLDPSTANVNTPIDILGVNFCGAMGGMGDGVCVQTVSGFVTFGTEMGVDRATVTSWKDERITVTVPNIEPGLMSVVVTVDGRPSNAKDFEITQ